MPYSFGEQIRCTVKYCNLSQSKNLRKISKNLKKIRNKENKKYVQEKNVFHITQAYYSIRLVETRSQVKTSYDSTSSKTSRTQFNKYDPHNNSQVVRFINTSISRLYYHKMKLLIFNANSKLKQSLCFHNLHDLRSFSCFIKEIRKPSFSKQERITYA